jgi:hypothetical protein
MFFRKFFCRICFISVWLAISLFIGYMVFKPIYIANSVIIPYSLEPYDICIRYPLAWAKIKCCFILSYVLSNSICANFLYSFLLRSCFSKVVKKNNSKKTMLLSCEPENLSLFVGKNENENLVFIPEKSLYQNIFVCGTIGSGKTSSCMYPFTKQLISYMSYNSNEKIGMLILDVKGNFYKQVVDFANFSGRLDDVHVIELGGNVFYNPLDKPHLKPSVIANRLKTILTLFSPNNSESYWLDKVEAVLTEAIKFCRLYNDNYVTFLELHKLVTVQDYFLEKMAIVKEKFTNGLLSKKDCYDAYSSIDFFEKELFALDTRTRSIIQSEITRITNCFVSDYDVLHTFCPKRDDINFTGFYDLIQNGEIVVLNMNIAQYQNLSKIIATYLKLDFQTEVLNRLSNKKCISERSVAFICDEFHEYCTTTDADFFAQSREAKCINIVATQSYSSLLHTLKDEYAVKVILQNMINKFWFRTDDSYTIDDIQKQIGKEDKVKIAKSISENAPKTNFHYLTNSFVSHNSGLSESINESIYNDFVYDSHFFTQELETFTCLSFLSDGYKILKPMKLKLIPYFVNKF